MKIAQPTDLLIFAISLYAMTSSICCAQSTPSEFAKLSLDQLFELSIDETQTEQHSPSPWSFAYNFKRVTFDGYLDGDTSLSRDEVWWQGLPEVRTSKNFPIVPTVISQQAQVISIGYQFGPKWRVHLSVPYLSQSTDHISSVPNYTDFTIDTSGLGDVVVSASHQLVNSAKNIWWFTAGLSLPTGSIDEQGDTPRAAGDQHLPYTMQLGSGTYDFPLQFSYQSLGAHDFSLNMSAVIRVGKNDRNYRLGNSYALAGRYNFTLGATIEPFIGVEILHSQAIHGRDVALLVEAPFAYPASITDPRLYGGDKLNGKVGFTWQFTDYLMLTVELAKPLYQNLNGPQPKENYRSALNISHVI
ncbi:MAG: hypothetical protein ACJA13_000861 [Paraglaciecola sp.]|jgi:hypothetical protein